MSTGSPASGEKEMGGSIAIKRTKDSLLLDHFAQPGQHRARRFLLHQLRVVNLAGGAACGA